MMLKASYLFLVLLIVGTGVSFGQVDDSSSMAKDTIEIVQRDTFTNVVWDTLYTQEVQKDKEQLEDYSELSEKERLEARRLALKAERAKELKPVKSGPDIRTSDRSIAYFLYPSALITGDFPSIKFGAVCAIEGKFGLVGTLGFLTRPTLISGQPFESVPKARYGLRGLDLGLEARYYTSSITKSTPFYISLGLSASLAPVKNQRYIDNAAGTFGRHQEATSNARQYELAGFLGWEGRSFAGVAFDAAFGLELGMKGLYTEDELLTADINNTDDFNFFGSRFTAANVLYPYTNIVIRLGIGLGKW